MRISRDWNEPPDEHRPMNIRRATTDDAATLAELGRRTFVDAFAADNRPEDLALYLERTYGEPQQRRELEHPDIVTLIGEDGGRAIAFVQLRRGGEPPPCVDGAAPVEIARFYVDRAWHGRGAAHELMRAACDAAATLLGGSTIWLGVWERNARAIAFYGKCGFTDAGSHLFLLGNDLQTDRLMVLPLPRAWSTI
jgi:ribosomal protein S18 acetylase RimI-like enzyme